MVDDGDATFEHAIVQASATDVAAISELLQANRPARGGSLTGDFPLDWVQREVAGSMPVLVARTVNVVDGVLFTAAKEHGQAPVVRAMLHAWPGSERAYVYGPVCIAQRARGQRLLERLYAHVRRQLAGREAILFVRRDNVVSLRAHARLGMREVAVFAHADESFAVLTDAPRVRR